METSWQGDSAFRLWQKEDVFIIMAMNNYWRKGRDRGGGGESNKHTNPFTSFWGHTGIPTEAKPETAVSNLCLLHA